jgi:hypothetical protein
MTEGLEVSMAKVVNQKKMNAFLKALLLSQARSVIAALLNMVNDPEVDRVLIEVRNALNDHYPVTGTTPFGLKRAARQSPKERRK